MGDEKQIPMYLQLRRALKKFKAMPLSERLERLIRAGVIKEPRATEARKRVAAMEAAKAAGQPPG
ncbi:MAG: hypothetical protein K2X87_24050 [Gemmataceae bacterium]|nr:hypothetical protein [Gemmataceae bacterium]